MLTTEQREQLRQGAMAWNVTLDVPTIDAYDQFAEMLSQENTRINLTRIPEEQIVPLHFLDSLSLAAAFPPAAKTRVLDLGTGAGFPGLPLAIAYPETNFLLVDGTGKKIAFLQAAISTLGLGNVTAVKGRAEDLGRMPVHHGKYDIVLARAVAKLSELAGWMLPFVRPGGVAIAYKSRDIAEEVKDAEIVIDAAGGSLESVFQVDLPDTDIVRKLVVMRKRVAQAAPSARNTARPSSISATQRKRSDRPSPR